MKKRISRRALMQMSIGLAGATALAACAPKVVKETVLVEKVVEKTVIVEATKAAEKQVVIRVHTNQQGQYYGAMKWALDKDILGWPSKHPNITVEFEPVTGWTSEYFPKISALVASKTLGDIVWFPPRHRNHIGWGIHYDIVMDLMPLVESTGYDLTQFYPGVVAAASYEGKFFWMPLTSEPVIPVMAFNKSLVEKWGLDMPQNDWTLDELVAWAKAGTREGVWGYYPTSMHPLSWGPQLRQFGVKFISDDGTKVFPDSEEALLKGLRYHYDLLYKDKTMAPPDPTFNTTDAFVAEKVLAYDVWPVYINHLPMRAEGKFDVDFVYCPIDKKGAKRRSMLNEHVHGVTTFSENPAEAFEFLKFISTEEVCVQNLFTGYGAPVGRPDLYEDERAIKAYPGLTLLKPIMEEIEPDFFVQNFRGEEFDKAFYDLTTELSLDEISVEECLEKILVECQAVVDKDPA